MREALPCRRDDTEIFLSQYLLSADASSRPKVLVIFDNSGSMDTIVPGQPQPYDPAITYPAYGDIQSGRIYWTDSADEVPEDDTKDWFSAAKSRCAESFTALGSGGVGFYQDNVLYWDSKKEEWKTLTDKQQDPAHVDCRADVVNSNQDNGTGQADGYPADDDADGYAAVANVSWDKSYTLYSANYLNWYYASLDPIDRERIEIARDVITDMIEANPAVDFGLMVFNKNDSDNNFNGGRVARRLIANMSPGERTSLVSLVDGLNVYYNTPLCESMYEAYRYLSGDSVLYGDDDPTATPARDAAAEATGIYKSPLQFCQYTYVILMTDGLPTRDNQADTAIETLTGKTCEEYGPDGSKTKNCMPTLAEYLYEEDLDGDDSNGIQRVLTYTIGFQTKQELLKDTARKGHGEYYTADSAEELSEAFQGAILEILANAGTFTSPAVAVDTFNRTRSRDDLILAMFEPRASTRWPGNIKKLKVHIANGEAEIRDANDQPAIDNNTGQIKEKAQTFWSTTQDGPVVEEGGAGGLLAARNPATRTIKSNTGLLGALETFNSTNLTYDAFGFATNGELFSFFDVIGQTELDALISWSRGVDVEDEDGDGSSTDTRPWILGDMLHSAPLTINYGALGSFTKDDPDLRLVVGTNAGFLHMFGVNDGVEDWAFFPKELAPVLNKRLVDKASSKHTYGIDSTAVAYTKDVNNDGTLSAAAGDKVFVYVGLRRGGRAYYALDLSAPGSPAFKWMISNATTGFSELGQSWSQPVATTIAGYVDGSGKPKPVIIFGGGYDADNKDTASVATTDSMGRAIYVVDADTGALVWSVSPAATVGSNKQETGLEHGIAARVVAMDSNGDGFTDRVYAADTGGNIWRADLAGTDKSKWGIVKLAAFNGGDAANDRRFFNMPDIVRARRGAMSFDAVLIGSGDRTNPTATDVTNRFYMIQDRQTSPYTTARPTTAECGTDLSPGTRYSDFRCKLPLGESALYDATADLIQEGDADERVAASADLYSASGWYITLEKTGEKSLASSLTVGGNVVFTTFSPETANENLCVPQPGQGYLYAVNLLDASAVFNFSGGDPDKLEKADRIAQMGTMILDTPSAHVGPDGRIRLIFPAGGTSGDEVEEMEGSIFDTQIQLSGAKGLYWYQEEY